MDIKNKILVVCHDAGGAEIISAYIKANKKNNFICYVSGPAKKIFKRKNIKTFPASSLRVSQVLFKNSDINFLLAGTSWSSAIELNFIRQAKLMGIRTVVYLDHWVNYRERFGYPQKKWQVNLPDEFWIGDEYALIQAKKFFKNSPCKLVPNLYFRESRNRYEKIRKTVRGPANFILFFSEPVRAPIGFTEFDVLNKLLSYFVKKKIKNKIVISRHPSEKKGKYRGILSRYSDKLRIIQSSRSENALKNIARACLVIGMQSMILVIAHLCGKKVVSFIPNRSITCPLPYDRIIKIKKMEELNKII